MKTVKVTYTTTAGYAGQNQSNIRRVMADLQKRKSPGIFYHVCLSPDGKTFTHTAFFHSEDDEKTLLQLPSFRQFQEELKASGPEAPPRQELPELVGSSREMFGA